jgi:hypothetical protein
MSLEMRNHPTSQRLAGNAIPDGFDELERYLRSSSPRLPAGETIEMAEPSVNVTDDPVRDGLDQLDRALKTAQLRANASS